MTLCIAWKENNTTHFLSDSRIYIDAEKKQYADIGIKVAKVPVKVFTPVDDETGLSEIVYDRYFGLCLAGGLTSAYLIKESIYEMCSEKYLLVYSSR